MVAKVLRPELAGEERALAELRREAEALERLAHPVIVRGFDAALCGPYPHLLMEHLEGPTLGRLIKKGGPLPLQQALPLALHVAAALHYMAHERMVHLDVKPDNIVMGVPPRLIDLSIACDLDRAARLRGPIGTDSYMAPEQCVELGRRRADRPRRRRVRARRHALSRADRREAASRASPRPARARTRSCASPSSGRSRCRYPTTFPPNSPAWSGECSTGTRPHARPRQRWRPSWSRSSRHSRGGFASAGAARERRA